MAKSSSKTIEEPRNKAESKDENLAFIAGANCKVGSRAVRELLKLGFRVRAGVRSAERSKSLVESVKKLNIEGAIGETQPVEKLKIGECDLVKKDRILPALGNASVVLCCIGAIEKEVFDITGPYRIDYLATNNLIEAVLGDVDEEHWENIHKLVIDTDSSCNNTYGWKMLSVLDQFRSSLKPITVEAIICTRIGYCIFGEKTGGTKNIDDEIDKLTQDVVELSLNKKDSGSNIDNSNEGEGSSQFSCYLVVNLKIMKLFVLKLKKKDQKVV